MGTIYCNSCGGDIDEDGICDFCGKAYRPYDFRGNYISIVGSPKKFIKDKMREAKKNKIKDSLFYNKEFIKDYTGITTFADAGLNIYHDYERIIQFGNMKKKVPRPVLNYRFASTGCIFHDNDVLLYRKSVRIGLMKMTDPNVEFFIDIGFDKKEKLAIVLGFSNRTKIRRENS